MEFSYNIDTSKFKITTQHQKNIKTAYRRNSTEVGLENRGISCLVA